MLKTRIIPCLDVADGRVVKGVNFVDLKDAGDPVEAAYTYDQAGADEICGKKTITRNKKKSKKPIKSIIFGTTNSLEKNEIKKEK